MSITDYIIAKTAAIVDARVTQGEVIFLELKPNVEIKDAIGAVIKDLIKYMNKSTGKLYSQQREPYSDNYKIFEPGHPSYGLKIYEQNNKIIIQPIAVLTDIDILHNYVRHLKMIDSEQGRDAGK